jgi:WD40 repeat protein
VGHATFRGNLCVNADGAAVYAAGGLGLVYRRNGHDQLVFGGHATAAPCASITCLASGSAERRFGACAASGDAAGRVCVWDACTAALRGCLPLGFYRGGPVAALALTSASRAEARGHLLVTVGGAASQGLLGLWASAAGDWTDPALLSATQAGPGLTYFCCWSESAPPPFDAPGARKHDWDFATGGDDWGAATSDSGSAPQFWSVAAGMPSAVKGTYAEGLAPERCITCGVGCGSVSGGGGGRDSSSSASPKAAAGVLASDGTALAAARLPLLACGGASGRLLLWVGTECASAVRAHASAVTDVRLIADLDVKPSALSVRAAGSLSATADPGRAGVVSGGLDGMVKVWAVAVGKAPTGSGLPDDASLALVSAFDVAAECVPRPVRAAVVAVAVDAAFAKLLVLTASAELVEVVRDSRAAAPLLVSHAQARPPVPAAAGQAPVGAGAAGCTPCWPHPANADVVATGGADGTVRLWSVSGRCQLACLEVGGPVSALCWRKDEAAADARSGFGLVACLAPSGQLCAVTVDARTLAIAKTKVLVPAVTPLPDSLVASADGALLKPTSRRSGDAAGDGAAGAVQVFLAATGEAAAERAVGSAKWASEVPAKGAAADADGACLFFF